MKAFLLRIIAAAAVVAVFVVAGFEVASALQPSKVPCADVFNAAGQPVHQWCPAPAGI